MLESAFKHFREKKHHINEGDYYYYFDIIKILPLLKCSSLDGKQHLAFPTDDPSAPSGWSPISAWINSSTSFK